VPGFKLKSLWVTILQGVEFSIFLLILAWALQQCSANALPVIAGCKQSMQIVAVDDPGRIHCTTGFSLHSFSITLRFQCLDVVMQLFNVGDLASQLYHAVHHTEICAS